MCGILEYNRQLQPLIFKEYKVLDIMKFAMAIVVVAIHTRPELSFRASERRREILQLKNMGQLERDIIKIADNIFNGIKWGLILGVVFGAIMFAVFFSL